ncbi:D-2-hydroxyacid dehydrogenase [Galbitalea soli]|uniref:D-2-hydroxyacid dehydrogenase n=1 Tax=Galbitalea soli TaxID=1268042 RepID=UPI00184C37F6|nr:phosphoglycerate dehydrogenase-like enzyme [Galbitalea soli]
MSESLRVVVSSPLSEELCRLIEEREPRVELVRDQSLLPPQRHPGDHRGDPAFVRTPEQQARFDALVDSADALYGLPDESARALRRTAEANPGLRWVHTMAAGGGAQVRVARLSEQQLARIRFTTSGGTHAQPLTEFAVFGVLAGAKELPRLRERQAAHQWDDRWAMGQVSEQTVVVVGLGGIGRRVAETLALLGATVIGVHRREVDAPGVSRIVSPEQLAEVVAVADAVVLALPGTEQTHRMLSREVLAAVKPGLTLVNVGRGTTVDEEALVEALQDGRIGFAALDVVYAEPLDASSPLWDLPNVLISPHSAALSSLEDRRIAELFAENATRLLDGRPLLNPVNTREFY